MSSEQSLLPGLNLRYPFVEHEQSRDPTEHRYPQKEDNQPPGGDAQVGTIESLEIQPCTDVDKTGTVKHKVNYSRERFFLGLLFEFTVPGHGCACKFGKTGSN